MRAESCAQNEIQAMKVKVRTNEVVKQGDIRVVHASECVTNIVRNQTRGEGDEVSGS